MIPRSAMKRAASVTLFASMARTAEYPVQKDQRNQSVHPKQRPVCMRGPIPGQKDLRPRFGQSLRWTST